MVGTHKQPMSPLHLGDLDSTSLHICNGKHHPQISSDIIHLMVACLPLCRSLKVHFNPQKKLPHGSLMCMPMCYEHTVITDLSPGVTALGTSPAVSVGVKCRHQITGICTTPTFPLHTPAAKMDHSPGGAIQESHLPTPF